MRRGVTLVELLVVMAIIALMIAITLPGLSAGLGAIVVRTDIDRAGSFFSKARLEADFRQQPVQLTVDPETGEISAVSVDGAWEDSFVLDQRSRMIFPKERQSLILHPSTPAPRFRLLLASGGGARVGTQINIFTGVPEEWNPSEEDVE